MIYVILFCFVFQNIHLAGNVNVLCCVVLLILIYDFKILLCFNKNSIVKFKEILFRLSLTLKLHMCFILNLKNLFLIFNF